jgi:hypothetical protein
MSNTATAGLAILLSSGPLGGAEAPHRPEGDNPTAAAVRAARVSAPIRIDGRLDDSAWAAALPVSTFTQIFPHEGSAASERTEVRVLFDDEALYVGAGLHDRSAVTSRLGRRDMPIGRDSDWFGVMLDSDHDHRTAFGFDVNPAGVKRDLIKTINIDDTSWEAVWEAATSVDSLGWTVEMRIPFSQLRYRNEAIQTWGIQLERLIARTGEYAVTTFIPSQEQGGVPRYGHLVGLEGIRTARRLEVLPYTVARLARDGSMPAGATSGARHGGAAGVDLQYRLTPEFTLNATVNPDFGQVEQDPAVINLTAFETRLEEKRPFFVEGMGLFEFAPSAVSQGSLYRNLFYSRRIGRAPQLSGTLAGGAAPQATTILGAAKLSGKSASGWSFGLLDALTQREVVTLPHEVDAGREILVEPLSHYLVTRVNRETRAGQSAMGAILTTLHRELESPAARATLRSAAYTGGIDFHHEWGQRTWRLSGYLTGSQVLGSAAAIQQAQRSSARYFQRPDADHLALDSTSARLGGYAAQLQLQKQGGKHWRGFAAIAASSPGYEVNDLGFQARTDLFNANLHVNYLQNTPGRLLRSYRIIGSGVAAYNFGGEQVGNTIFFGSNWQFQNFWSATLNAGYSFESWDDRLTRGGPITRRPEDGRIAVNLVSDSRQPITGSLTAYGGRDAAGASTLRTGLTLGVRPSSRLNLSLGPQVERGRQPAQYLAAVTDVRAVATFGRRYVFAELDQTTVSLDARLNLTMTPGLSVELFAQPFLSSVAFGDPKELRAARANDFFVYGRDVGQVERMGRAYRIDPDGPGGAPAFQLPDPDFNQRSLRGNAVVRWEWRPGSTLYLAWQQLREDRQPIDDFALGRDTRSLLGAPARNVVLLKVNYWLSF